MAAVAQTNKSRKAILDVVIDGIFLKKDANHVLLDEIDVHLWLNHVHQIAVASIYKNDADNVTFMVSQIEWLAHALNLTASIVITEAILAAEGLKDVSFIEGTIELQDDVIFLQSILIVLVGGFEENLKLRLHTSANWITEHELFGFASQEARLDHEFFMDKTGVEHFKVAKLLDHPLNHGLSSALRRHHLNGARYL